MQSTAVLGNNVEGGASSVGQQVLHDVCKSSFKLLATMIIIQHAEPVFQPRIESERDSIPATDSLSNDKQELDYHERGEMLDDCEADHMSSQGYDVCI